MKDTKIVYDVMYERDAADDDDGYRASQASVLKARSLLHSWRGRFNTSSEDGRIRADYVMSRGMLTLISDGPEHVFAEHTDQQGWKITYEFEGVTGYLVKGDTGGNEVAAKESEVAHQKLDNYDELARLLFAGDKQELRSQAARD